MGQETIGPYQIVRQLGRGGMGVVYSVTHPEMPGRTLALKLLERAAIRGERGVQRFQREGEALARVSHPGVVSVHAAGEAAQGYYLVTDEVLGENLKATLGAGPLPPEEVARIGLRLCSALAALHAEGVLHRDLKPENVILQPNREPVLIDFGLAKDLLGEDLTQTGTLLGTPAYMAPEQADGRTGKLQDPRVDVYGLGATLFSLVVGRPPYRSDGGHLALVSKVLQGKPEWPEVGVIPPDLEAILRRSMATHQYKRHPSVGAMAADLQRFLDGKRVRPRRWPLVLASVACLAGVAAFALREPAAPPPPPLVLRLEAPPSGRLRVSPIEVRGVVTGAVGVARVRCGETLVRVRDGGRFSISVELQRGSNTLRVTASDGEQRTDAEEWLVDYRPAPDWFYGLSAESRPSLPLPRGLSFAEGRGEYAHVSGLILVYVPPAVFTMGRNAGDEGPEHLFSLEQGYFIGKYKVHCGAYRSYCGSTDAAVPDAIQEDGDDQPVRGVRWDEALAYCQKQGLRLPSEAEWEYTARGQDKRHFPWGPELPNSDQAHQARLGGYFETAAVGGYPADTSPFGCMDMAGNVREWTADLFGFYPKSPGTEPRREPPPPFGGSRVVRGGMFNLSNEKQLQSLTTYRGHRGETQGYAGVGFRVALSHP